ncbi:MAG: DUF4160 domain-containing protein [Bacteroidetes bacterium]|nr:DUF4160 domain-containing protein [Bacteroidota bacterium]
MNFNEHNPPHFHAKYDNFQIMVEIKSGIIEGKFPPRSLKLVLEWYEIHKVELLNIWTSLQTTGKFEKIEPLE